MVDILCSNIIFRQWWTVCYLRLLYGNSKFRKMFLSPIRDLNTQSSDLQWDALTIEVTGLRWKRECYDVYCFVCATYVYTVNVADLMSVYTLLLNYKASNLAGPHQLNNLPNREWISYIGIPGIFNPIGLYHLICPQPLSRNPGIIQG